MDHCACRSDTLTIAQARDGRAYRFVNDPLELLKEDQAVVNMMVKKRRLTPGEAQPHPDRHVTLQAMGQEGSVAPDIQSIPYQHGNCLLLGSNGLSSFVSYTDIEAMLP